MKKILIACCALWLFSSCGEYYKVQKSYDPEERYSYAKKYYNEKKYSRVVTLMEDIVQSFARTSEGPQSAYLLADSYMNLGRLDEASKMFQDYYISYPQAPMVEDAHYKAGLCLYRLSPDPKLDQTDTYGAIKELESYLEFYPKGTHREEVEGMLFSLQDKLAYKEYLSAKLYYDMGLYLGNNYQSAVITAQNALKDFPYTRHREELLFIILSAKSDEALMSVLDKQQMRLREAIDYYYTYVNEFPEGKYLKDAKRIYEKVSAQLHKD